MGEKLPLPKSEQNQTNFLFDIKFDGSSFNGVMKIQHLHEELKSLEYCLNQIIKELIQNNQLPNNIMDEHDIIVEAFENNCFRKRIKLAIKTIESHPTTSIIITTLLTGCITIAPSIIQNKNQLTQASISQIENTVTLNLLSNQKFIEAIGNIVAQPLEHKNDSCQIIPPPNSGLELIEIPYSKKSYYIPGLKSNQEKTNDDSSDHNIKTYHTDLYGKIVAIDLDAKTNQLYFKQLNKKNRIRGTLIDELNIEDYKKLLGEQVKITGEVSLIDGKEKSITIEKILRNPQEKLF